MPITKPDFIEEIIKNPLTNRIKESIAKSKERLNFAVPFLSPFALKLLDKKAISKIADKRIITRFDERSLLSFDLETLSMLLELGFDIRFDNAIHLKLYIADDDVYVTSSNLTQAGFETSIELTVKTDAANIANCATLFNEIWKKCSSNILTKDIIKENWGKYELLCEREKYANARKKPGDIKRIVGGVGGDYFGDSGYKLGINLEKLIGEIFNQGVDSEIEKLVVEANKQRAEMKRGAWKNPAGGFETSRFYSTYGDGKGTLLYDFAHGIESKIAGTGLRDHQFMAAFKHPEFEKVIAYIYPESIGMKPWNFNDKEEFLEFCNGLFNFKIPHYKEALPIRLASYFYPDYFFTIFNLDDLGEICYILSGSKVNNEDGDATPGDKLYYYTSTLADKMRALPFDNYMKACFAYQILYAARLYKRINNGEKYEEILKEHKTEWEKRLLEKGRDLFIKLGIIDDAARLEVIDKPVDQAVLSRIAKDDPSRVTRAAAAGKLADQTRLAKIAQNDKEEESVRVSAIGRLTDQTVLTALATPDGAGNYPRIREAAVKNLTDQELLARYGEKDKIDFVRTAAVEKLTDQAVLARIAKGGKFTFPCLAAVKKITDQAVLAEVAKKDWPGMASVREAAVEKLDDRALLSRIAKNDEDERVREAAATRLAALKK